MPDGLAVFRRRAHLVVWDDAQRVTVPAWPLYWSDQLECTFVRVEDKGAERVYIPLFGLVGHWDWYTGTVAGFRVADGYGPHGMPMPKVERLTPTQMPDADTGRMYWLVDVTQRKPDPMAHT